MSTDYWKHWKHLWEQEGVAWGGVGFSVRVLRLSSQTGTRPHESANLGSNAINDSHQITTKVYAQVLYSYIPQEGMSNILDCLDLMSFIFFQILSASLHAQTGPVRPVMVGGFSQLKGNNKKKNTHTSRFKSSPNKTRETEREISHAR